jgi:hypothetical protein
MIHARSIKDMLKRVPLNEDFYLNLDTFHLNYVDMCFKRMLDEQMGMMTELEFRNYQNFMKFKSEYQEEFYLEIKSPKKAA